MTDEIAIKRDEKGHFLKGNPPGPGRPPGSAYPSKLMRKLFRENPSKFLELLKELQTT